jgi:hypothetical protein
MLGGVVSEVTGDPPPRLVRLQRSPEDFFGISEREASSWLRMRPVEWWTPAPETGLGLTTAPEKGADLFGLELDRRDVDAKGSDEGSGRASGGNGGGRGTVVDVLFEGGKGRQSRDTRAVGCKWTDRRTSAKDFYQIFVGSCVMSVKNSDGIQLRVERFQKSADVSSGERSMQRFHRNDDGVRSGVVEPKIGVADGVRICVANRPEGEFVPRSLAAAV